LDTIIEGIPDSLVTAIRYALRDMVDQGESLAVHELVEKCRDDTHTMFGNSSDILIDRYMIRQNGSPQAGVCEVVKKYVGGSGLDMTFNF
jgi:hypothetical protein